MKSGGRGDDDDDEVADHDGQHHDEEGEGEVKTDVAELKDLGRTSTRKKLVLLKLTAALLGISCNIFTALPVVSIIKLF